jgi:hypothetical protein
VEKLSGEELEQKLEAVQQFVKVCQQQAIIQNMFYTENTVVESSKKTHVD